MEEQFQPKLIAPGEYHFLSGLVWLLLGIGVAGGVVLGIALDGDTAIQGTYWSQLLTVAGVSALPLIAVAVRMPRLRGETGWERPARVSILVAFPIVLAVIGLCLDRLAVTPKDGANPPDFFLYATAIGIGLILAAIATGVMADVLDKIDPKEPS